MATPSVATVKRYHAYQGAFSRRTAIRQIEDFLCSRIGVKAEDLRLWHFRDEASMFLLEADGSLTLEVVQAFFLHPLHATTAFWQSL